jgi:23S rRNA (pseudouridine1915-N3)-methyltransferase
LLKVRIVTIGKEKDRWITEGCNHYLKLLKKFARVEIKLLPSLKAVSSLSPSQIKGREAEQLEPECGSGYLIALHDRGKKFDSPGFAERLERLQIESGGSVVFVIGGAYGLDDRILKRSRLQLSLSDLTFSHQMTRLILLEQLYRGFSILHHTAYHK